eukprot:g4214.t1
MYTIGYPANVSRSRTPDDENCSMVPGANALAGWLKWPNEPDDLIVVQSSGDLRGHITTALVEQLEAYGGRRISKIFETHNAETNHVDEEDADEGFAFVLVGRHGLGYGMGHQRALIKRRSGNEALGLNAYDCDCEKKNIANASKLE